MENLLLKIFHFSYFRFHFTFALTRNAQTRLHAYIHTHTHGWTDMDGRTDERSLQISAMDFIFDFYYYFAEPLLLNLIGSETEFGGRYWLWLCGYGLRLVDESTSHNNTTTQIQLQCDVCCVLWCGKTVQKCSFSVILHLLPALWWMNWYRRRHNYYYDCAETWIETETEIETEIDAADFQRRRRRHRVAKKKEKQQSNWILNWVTMCLCVALDAVVHRLKLSNAIS